MLTSITTN